MPIRTFPGSNLPSYDLVGQRKASEIHIFNNSPDDFRGAALWASHTRERTFSGGYGASELQRKKFPQTNLGSFSFCPGPQPPLRPPFVVALSFP